MKLIIDTPEDAYYNGQLLQYFKCGSEKLDEVMYSGTVVRDVPDGSKTSLLDKMEAEFGPDWDAPRGDNS